MAKVTDKDLAWAISQMSMLRYFPSSEAGEMAQEAIVSLLRKLTTDQAQLRWLINQMVDHVGIWPGPSEMRGLFCSRFRPADGIEADCTLPGYSPADGELASARKDVPALSQGEAVKLIEELKDPAMRIREDIREQREMMRQFSSFPETVRGCAAKILELERQLRELNCGGEAAAA